jgi:ATP-dependent helicase/nuclease subunit B
MSHALLGGELIADFPSGGSLELARATIYLPTQRAAAAFARELFRARGGDSVILPRIAPLGAFEPTPDFDEIDATATPRLAERPAVGDLTRRMVLAQMTRAWGEALRGAIRRVDAAGRLAFDETEAPLVASSPAQALALAGDLAALIDDMIIEGVAWEKLDGLVADAFDPYWRITLDFLRIAVAAWPNWLAEHGLVDRARHAALRVEAEIEALRAGVTRGPTIIAGSTGTNRATARLIGAIARAPQGAVVLPDLDKDLNGEAWEMIGADDESASAGHPQAALRRLLRLIGVDRKEVKPLGAPAPRLNARARFLSEALRPAESTHFWRRKRDNLDEAAIEEALADVALLTAENEAEEALALAIAMRETLETPGKTAALITPNPAIAKRVTAELERWGIEAENSAGRTLADTSGGVFARLILAAALDFAPLPLAALIGHPLCQLGRSREDFASQARALDLSVLRTILPAPGLDNIEGAFVAVREARTNKHPHPAIKLIDEKDLSGAESLLRDLAVALAALRELGAGAPLETFIAAHREALAALAAPTNLAAAAGGEALMALFDEWSLASEGGFACTLGDYGALCGSLLATQRAPPTNAGHPRLAILGLLEARLLSFDFVLLAGLDETVWPPAASTDAFLNRPMRREIGLSPPERRIGQTAHDFVSALGARQVLIARAKKRGGSPTVASRFLQRIGAVAGDDAIKCAEARGERYIRLARALDRTVAVEPIGRPEPRPKRNLRPNQLSVTRIETLRRDPYSIYAERILRLTPLPLIDPKVGAREIGEIWHDTLQQYSQDTGQDESPETRLRRIAGRAFAPLNADPAFRALQWPRVLEGLKVFLDFDAKRRTLAGRIFAECQGKLDIPLSDGSMFVLTARADRIERLNEGGAAIIDYKTGKPPGVEEVKVGFAPQLTLEAAMLSRGAFAEIGALEAETAIYLKLGGADGGFTRELYFKDATFGEVVEKHFAELKTLLEQFADETTPYLPRPFPKFVARGSDYAHLARVKEWSATGGETDGDGEAL